MRAPGAGSGPAGWLPLLPLALVGLASLPAAVFGLAQAAATLAGQVAGPAYAIDFLTYYAGGALLLADPTRLYDAQAGAALQAALRGGREDVYLQFWNPPHVALLFAPLALLPHGPAYATWAGLNLAALVGAAHLLAPGTGRTRWGWAAAGLLFLPVQLNLVLGQTSGMALLGYCALARWWMGGAGHGLAGGGPGGMRDRVAALALLPWTFKPQVLLALALALLLDRRWRVIAGAALLAGSLALLALARTGPGPVAAFLALGAEKTARVLARADSPGQTPLGLAQSLVGVGSAATALAVLSALGVLGGVAWLWRAGLRPGPTAYLQLAALPVAATLAAPHALAYSLAPWLASGWLVARYAQRVPRRRSAALGVLALGWAAGNVAVLTEWTGGLEWGALGGVGVLLALARLAEGRGLRGKD